MPVYSLEIPLLYCYNTVLWSVVVILYHTANRNIQMQFVKNLQGNVDLSLTTIHHKDVRIDFKTFIGKSSCQNLAHTGVVIRSVDRS